MGRRRRPRSTPSQHPGVVGCAAAAAVVVLGGGGVALALPEGMVVTGGQLELQHTDANNALIRQATERAAADFNSFNIDAGQRVQIQQPGASSLFLGRITNGQITQIHGQLDANGRVILVNPAGLVVGPGGVVNTAAFTATTLNVDLQRFMQGGALELKALPGSPANASVVNNGRITVTDGGFAALIAPQVVNNGVITAKLGQVQLASGTQATLDISGDGLLSVALDPAVAGSITANGTIQATHVRIGGGDAALLAASTVQLGGLIEARSNAEALGTGGSITVEGDQILVKSGARLDASGEAGGGQILVGGSWQNSDPTVRQATNTTVESGAVLDASATGQGDGGTVVVWSDITKPQGVTTVAGSLRATGGSQGGNGGRLETSGFALDTAGVQINTSAAQGLAGLWLLDPYNITIAAAGASGTTFPTSTPYNYTASSNSTILASDISAALTGGNNVTISTGTGGSNSDGTITIDAAISKTGGNAATLTLNAAQNIAINQPINLSSNGELNLIAGTLINGNGLITANSLSAAAQTGITIDTAVTTFSSITNSTSGAIQITQTGAIAIPATLVTTGRVQITATGNITVGNPINAPGRTVHLTSSGGSINGGSLITGNMATLQATTGIGNSSALNLAASNISADTTDGKINLANTLGTNVTVSSLTARYLGNPATDPGPGGPLITFNQSGGGTVTFNNVSSTNSTAGSGWGVVNLTNAGGGITIASSGVNTAGTTSTISLSTTGSGNIAVNAPLDAGLNDGDVYLLSAGSITGAGLITGYTSSLVAQTGLTANASVSQGFSAISSAAGDINVTNVWGISLPNAITATGNVSLTSSQDILLSNPITASGNTVTLTATGTSGGGEIQGGSLVTANTVDLNATTGIGNSSALNLAASNISADTTDGKINLANTLGTNVTVSSLTARYLGNPATDPGPGGPLITFNQSGGGTVTFNNVSSTNSTAGSGWGVVNLTNAGGGITIASSGVNTAGTTSTISLSTTGSGNIAVNAPLDAGLNDGDVYLLSAGSITGAGLITGYTSSLVAQTGLTANASVSQGFSAISSAAGDINVTNVWGISLPNAITATGNVSLTSSQDILLSNPITASGNTVTLTATGTSGGGEIQGGSLVTANTVDLNATTGIGNSSALNLAASNISADTTDGAIDINNTSSTITSISSLTTSGGAAITFDQTGAGGIALNGNVTSTTGTVSISSLQAINRTSGTITAGTLNLDAVTGIGNSSALNLAASNISADTTDGKINLANTLGTNVTVSSLTARYLGNPATDPGPGGPLITFNQSGGGTVTFNNVSSTNSTAGSGWGVVNLTNAGGGITIASSGVNTAGTTSTISLSTTGSGNIAVNAPLDAGLNDGDVYLLSAGSITGAGLITGYTSSLVAQTGLTANASVSQGFSAISSAAGDINVTNVWGISLPNAITATGNVSLTSSQDILLSNPITASGNTVTLTATGTSGGGEIQGGSLVTANTVDLNATTGIGNSSALNLAASNISADTTDGAIDINNTSSTITSISSLTTSGGAAITFDQTGAGGIALNGNVTSTTGTVSISSLQAINRTSGTITAGTLNLDAVTGIGNSSALNLAASNISADTTDGKIDINNTSSTTTSISSLTTSGGAAITFDQTGAGGIALNGNVTSTTGTVSISSLQAINRTSGTITAGTLNLDAVTGIGNSSALNLAASNISADTTDGKINLANTLGTNVTVSSLTTTGNSTNNPTGDLITFSQSGGGTVTFSNASSAGSDPGYGVIKLTNASGGITVAGNIVTGGNAITIDNGSGGDTSVVLTAGSTLDTTNGGAVATGGAVTIRGTITSDTSSFSLIVTGGTAGDVLVTDTIGAVGSGVALGSLVITGNDITLASIDGVVGNTSIIAADGTDTGSLTLTSQTYRTTGAIELSSGVTGTNPLQLTGGAAGTTTTITTAGGQVEISGALDLNARNLTIDTTAAGSAAAGGNLLVNNSIDGAGDLAIDAGTAGVVAVNQLGGNVGSTTPLTSFTITNAGEVLVGGALTAGTLTITDTTDYVQIAGVLTLTGGLVTTAQPYDLTFFGGNNGTNSIAGATTFLNTGDLRFGDQGPGDVFTFVGGAVATDPAAITLNATIAANTGAITLGDSDTTVTVLGAANIGGASTGAITLGDVQLNQGTQIFLGTGIANAIQVGAITGTAGSLGEQVTIDTTAAATVTGAVGTDIGNLTITNSGGTTFQSTVAADLVTITDTTGTVTFQGALTATALTANSLPYAVELLGNGSTIASAVIFSNTGGVTLGDGGDTITFTGGVTSTASTTTINGTVATTGDSAVFNAVTLAGNSVIDAGGGIETQAITGGGFDLQLISDNSDTNIYGAATGLDTVTLMSNAASTGLVWFRNALVATEIVTFAQGYRVRLAESGTTTITNATTFLNTGTLQIGGSGTQATFAGGLDTTAGPSSLVIAGTIATTNTALTLGAAQLFSDTTLTSGSGAITVGSASTPGAAFFTLGNASQTGTVTITGDVSLAVGFLDAAAGAFDVVLGGSTNTIGSGTFLNTGSLTVGTAGGTSTFSNGLTAATQSAVNLAGVIQATDSPIALGDVTLLADTTLRAGLGQIGTGAVTQGLGTSTLTLGSATQTGDITLGGDLTLDGLATVAGAYGVQLAGAANDITQAVTFTNTVFVGLGDAVDDVSLFRGGLSIAGLTGNTFLEGTVRSIGQPITLDNTKLTGNATIDTTNAGNVPTGATITLDGGVLLEGFTLTTIGGSAPSSSTNLVGATNLSNGNLIVQSGALNIGAPSSISLGSNIVTGGNAITIDNGSGGDTSVVLTAGSTLDTTNGGAVATGGAVTIRGTITSDTSSFSLIVTGGTAGDVLVTDTIGAVGSGVALGSLVITGNDITLASIDGVVGNTSIIAADGTDTGSLTLTSQTYRTTGAIELSSGVTGTNPLQLTGGAAGTTTTITTAGGQVEISGALDLNARNLTIDTTAAGSAAAGGNLLVNNSIDGAGDLAIDAGTAGVVAVNQLGGNVGSTTPLTSFTITNAGEVLVGGALTAGTLTITDTTDYVQIAGVLTLTGGLVTTAQPYDLTFFGGNNGTNSIAGATTFLNTGDLRFGDQGPGDVFTFVGGAVATDPAAITLNATIAANTGAITLGDSDTTVTVLGAANIGGASTGAITLGDVQLNQGTQIFLGTGIANAIQVGAITGTAGSLGEQVTIDTTAAATVTGAVGTDIGNLTITNSGGTTFQSTVAADLVTITDTTGTVAFQGALTSDNLTTAANPYSVSLTGNGSTINNAVTFLNTGGVTLGDAASDLLTFTGGLDTTAVLLGTTTAGTITTTNTPIALGAVTLTANTTLGSGSGAITLDGGVNGAGYSLNLDGNAIFNGAVSNLSSLSVGGTSTIRSSSIATSGAQSYTGLIMLDSANTSLSGSTPTFSSGIAGAGNSLSLNFSGITALNGASITGVANLSTGSSGTTDLTGSIQTTGAQSYGNSVNATANTTLSPIGMLNFASTLNTEGNLRLNTNGGNLNLGTASIIRGSFTAVTNNGKISQIGPLVVQGNTTLSTGSGDIILTNPDNMFAKVPLRIMSSGTVQIYSKSFQDSPVLQVSLETNTGLNQNRQIANNNSNQYQINLGQNAEPHKPNFAVQTQRNERYIIGQSSLKINAGEDVCLSVVGCGNQTMIEPVNPTKTTLPLGELQLNIRGIDERTVLPNTDLLLKAANKLGKAYNASKAHLLMLTHWLQSRR